MTDKTEMPDKSKTSEFPEGGNITFNWRESEGYLKDIFDVTISNANNN